MAYSIYIKHMFRTVGCFENAILLHLPGFTVASSFPYTNCVILVRSKFLSLCKTNKQTTLRAEIFLPMAFSVYEVVRVAFLSRSYKTNWLRDWHTSDANDIVNAKNHAREKPELAGYKQTNKQTNKTIKTGWILVVAANWRWDCGNGLFTRFDKFINILNFYLGICNFASSSLESKHVKYTQSPQEKVIQHLWSFKARLFYRDSITNLFPS